MEYKFPIDHNKSTTHSLPIAVKMQHCFLSWHILIYSHFHLEFIDASFPGFFFVERFVPIIVGDIRIQILRLCLFQKSCTYGPSITLVKCNVSRASFDRITYIYAVTTTSTTCLKPAAPLLCYIYRLLNIYAKLHFYIKLEVLALFVK